MQGQEYTDLVMFGFWRVNEDSRRLTGRERRAEARLSGGKERDRQEKVGETENQKGKKRRGGVKGEGIRTEEDGQAAR
ncbi:hypothetical protein E2C01_058824 [Portunus trituberculatus]|uniref:Uncharacterized protein n=1 Tax=Portunus trituberculatus TaxID=210409 RepID=A0A5B7H7F1_PORTR|nr:hypothetical protein [Portunus trituberculatus]